MFTPAIRRMIENGSAKVGPPVRITGLRNSVILPAAIAQAVDLELPPSTNNLFFNGKGNQGGRIKTPEYREWIAAAVPTIAALRPLRFPPFAIVFTLFGGVGLNMSRDLGNLEKPITDAIVSASILPGDSLAAGLWELTLKFRDQDTGRAFVRVELSEGKPSI